MPALEMKGLIDALGFTAKSVKLLKDMDDKVKRNEAVFDIQTALLNAQQMALDNQQSMAAIIESKSALEKEIAALRAFEAEKARYAMHQTIAGGITYLIKEDARNGEPLHHICANCYEKSVKSILQLNNLFLKCGTCGEVVQEQDRPIGFMV